ncbi:MAG: hypothetical protein LUD68_03305 [Rikenellaceae bacterium]|nr:hypothetical protein [Rikenellaceae bacterium]
MKNTFIFLLFFAVFIPVFSGSAQQRLDVQLTDRPVRELFGLIEEHSGWRVFAPQDEELDSLLVTVRRSGILPQELLAEVLEDSPYEVSVYRQNLFVLRERRLITTVSEPKVVRTAGMERPPSAPDGAAGNFRLARQELGDGFRL